MDAVGTHPEILCADSLSVAQRLILFDYMYHLKDLAQGKTSEQKLIIVTGVSGSGKSQVFLQTKHVLDGLKWANLHFDYIACGHTKASASWLGCSTLNEIFPPLPNKKILSGCRFPYWCTGFRRSRHGQQLNQANVLIIDDFASVGQEKLSRMDLQLRVANPLTSSQPFGGKTIILFGSPFTGPRPVMDTCLFEPYRYIDPEKKFENPFLLYLKFDTVYYLTHSFRHTLDNVEETAKYMQFLDRMKKGVCTLEDAEYVRSRCVYRVSVREVLKFDRALHVFQLKAQAECFNNYALTTLFSHVFKLEQGKHILRFAVGCPVFLTRNICREDGLFSFARGIVKAVRFEDGFELCDVAESTFMASSRILYIAVHFPTFTGNYDSVEVDGKKCFKVKRIHTQYTEGDRFGMGVGYSYKFPIMAAYATYRHNLENVEVDKVVLHMGMGQMLMGTDYLAFTRVDSMEDILIADDYVSNTRLGLYRLKDWNEYVDEEFRLSKMAKFQSESKNVTRYLMHREMGLLNKKK